MLLTLSSTLYPLTFSFCSETEKGDGKVTFRGLKEDRGGDGGAESEGGMEDPTGPPFGIVLNGHSLVSHP